MTAQLPSQVYNEKMTSVHATVIGICFLMNMCDGLSVMIISYTAPSITKEWQLDSGKFGIVFSAGLAGMALGAMFLASFADKIGRKAMIIICAAWMGIGIFLTAYVQDLRPVGPSSVFQWHGHRKYAGLHISPGFRICTSEIKSILG